MTQRPRPSATQFVARRFKLSTVGALTALVYLLTFVFYLRGPDSHARTAKELFAWFCVLTLLPLFHAGYVRVRDAGAGAPSPVVVIFGALFCLIAVFVYPFHSTDVFGYINRGWQQVHYHQNPYVYTTAEMPGWQQDPMVWEHWIYNPNPYGFLFTLLARVLAWLGGGNWTLTLGLFKLLNAAAYAFTAWLVWKGAHLLGQDRPAVALYAFMWNPLVLMHHIANGHNDILVGCLVALALYLAVRGAELWIIPVLVAATFLKYAPALPVPPALPTFPKAAPAPLVPPALVFIIKSKGWKTAAAGCALGALVAVLVSLPYVQDWRQFRLEDIRDNASLIDNSLHSLLIHIYENL